MAFAFQQENRTSRSRLEARLQQLSPADLRRTSPSGCNLTTFEYTPDYLFMGL
jgi:hypothetical protein